jgi:RNA polymerase sigma-70 factor (ECF subfamily)
MTPETDTTVTTLRTPEARTELEAAFADEVAFRAWYDRNLPVVYGYLFHRCGRNPELAEELTQQAFVEAVRNRKRFRGEAGAATWVIGIARHKLVDHFRRAEREQGRLIPLDTLAPDRLGSSPNAPDEIDDALAVLPSLQRAVLVLHYMDRLSVRDVGRAIGKSEAATASLLARGRDAFRRAYTEADR